MTIYLSNRDGNGKTNEEGHYRLQTRILKGNVLLADDLKVVQTSPLSLGVKVSVGDYRIETSAGYSYTGWLDAEETVSISTADPANPRITSIVLYVKKDAATSASPPNNPGVAKIVAVNGSAAASPSAPSNSAILSQIGAGNPYIKLADVTVGASATQVSNSNIADTRVRMGLLDDLLSSSSLKSIIGTVMYPVGSLYFNVDSSTNPSSILGFGTWERYALGRTLVGQDAGQTEFATLNQVGGEKTHRHKGYADGDGYGNGDLRATIGARSGDANSINYQAISPINPNTGSGMGNGTYAPLAPNQAGNQGFSHYTKVVGYTSTNPNLAPYIVVYIWKRTA